MVVAERSGSNNGNAQWICGSHLLDGSFHRLAAAGIQLQQLRHLVV
jgi:hypothetical protein